MEAAELAEFSLQDYSITHFVLASPTPMPQMGEMKIEFNPSGKYDEEKRTFNLTFQFIVFYGDDVNIIEHQLINATIESIFTFPRPTQFHEIPDFFYVNSMAVVFPHIRGFISMVTTLSNTRRIILPLLNLTQLEPILRINTTAIS